MPHPVERLGRSRYRTRSSRFGEAWEVFMSKGEAAYVILCGAAMLIYGGVLFYYGVVSGRHPQGKGGALPPQTSHDSHGH
jgi:hypothetical protein